MRLQRFYAGAPVCTPTRASVMTGRNAFRSKTEWAGRYPLPAQEVTIADLLRSVGYRTGFFGKWHLGKLTADGREVFPNEKPAPQEFSPPWRHGFDVCFAAEFSVPTYNPAVWSNAWTATPDKKTTKYVMDQPLAYGQGTIVGHKMEAWPCTFWREGERPAGRELAGDSSKLITDEAIEFIGASAQTNKPFFAVIWLFTPHSPVAASNNDREKYPEQDIVRQHWYGSISAMDTQIGRVRESLGKLGVADNTIVHFCSDNGPSWVTDLGTTGTFRGRKGEVYEGGLRVPAIIEWPARLKGGRGVDVPMSTDDLLPTIAAIIGAPLPPNRPLDGQNILPLIEGTAIDRTAPLFFRSMVRQSSEGWQAGTVHQSAIVDGRWKLVSVDDDKTFALYDLATDPSEQHDLAASEGERIETMKALLAARVKSFESSAKGEDYRN